MDFRDREGANKYPLVTVGLLSYNYSMYVIETLNSILAQSYCNVELFIVDDASKDNSVALIEQWILHNNLHVNFIIHQTNKGRTYTCNEIIRNAKGKYLVLFASDDVMNEHNLTEQVNAFENVDDSFAICYGDTELINEQGKQFAYFFRGTQTQMLKGDVLEAYFNDGFSIPAPSVMMRKSVFDKIGFYDERLHAEDFGMWMKILPQFKVTYTNYIGVKYRIRANESLNPNAWNANNDKYHRDRIWILANLFDTLKSNKNYSLLQFKIKRKLKYHIINLKILNSSFFYKMLLFLLKKGHFSVLCKQLIFGNPKP
jgi:hypothetical protein